MGKTQLFSMINQGKLINSATRGHMSVRIIKCEGQQTACKGVCVCVHTCVCVCADYQVNLPMSVCETFHCRCVCSCLVRFISADLSKDQGNQLASQRKRNIIETLVHIKSCTFQLLILSSSFNLFSKIS